MFITKLSHKISPSLLQDYHVYILIIGDIFKISVTDKTLNIIRKENYKNNLKDKYI